MIPREVDALQVRDFLGLVDACDDYIKQMKETS